jgi:hypothetical protein
MYNLLWQQTDLLKRGIIFFCIFFSFHNIQAQFRDQLNLPDHDDKKYHIGIVIMAASSRFNVSQHPMFLQSDSVLVSSPENSNGIGLGGMHTFRLNDRFEARVVFPQLIFASKAITYHTRNFSDGQVKIEKKNIESILLGLPIQVKFRSDRIQNFRVYMMGGVKFEYDLASKAAARNAEDLIKLKSSDFGIEAGIGFNFYMPYFILSPEIKISNGLSDSHSRDPNLKFSNVIDKLKSRMIVLSLIFEG